MRLGTILALALLSLVAVPRTASAQCVAFLAGVACSPSTRPVFRGDFGPQNLAPKSPKQSPKRRSVASLPTAPAANEPTPIDCQMIKSVDPRFRSAMPVGLPDLNVPFPMLTIQAPV